MEIAIVGCANVLAGYPQEEQSALNWEMNKNTRFV